MKKLITITLAALLSAPAMANDNPCPDIYELAKSIMTGRQNGVPLIKMIEVGKGNSVINAMVLDAYESPMFHGDLAKGRQINEFANKNAVMCYKIMASKK